MITTTESVKMYLKDVRKYPLLSPKEELSAARGAKEGDMKSRELLINSNLRFVINIAKDYYTEDRKLDDLIQQGNLGLIKAVEKFDPDKGYRFISYAVWWIRQSIGRYVMNQMHLNLNKITLKKSIDEITREYFEEKGESPSSEYIAEKLSNLRGKKYSPKRIRDFMYNYDLTNKTISLDQPIGHNEEYDNLVDLIEARGNMEEDITDSIIEETIREEIKELDSKSVSGKVLEEKLFKYKGVSEISEETGIKRSTIAMRYANGIKMVRRLLEEKGLYKEDVQKR